MLRFLIGLFIILHGLVHLWYFTLSRGLVKFQPEMGWTGRSWIFTSLLGDPTTRWLASVLYILATIGLVMSGLGIFLLARGMVANSLGGLGYIIRCDHPAHVGWRPAIDHPKGIDWISD